MKRPKIGDILEIPTAKGLAYAQYTHQHPQFGALIRVFDAFFDTRPSDFSKLADGQVRFSTFFPLAAAVKRSIFATVGHEGISPENKPFPIFRDGIADPKTKKVAVWWLWDGTKERKIGSLTPEQRQLPIRSVWNDTMLVKRIETGWTSSNDER